MDFDVQDELRAWPDRLEAITRRCDHVRRIAVLGKTDSTQDAARRLKLAEGEAVTAGVQTHGRGRRGREWSSNAGGGVQITFVFAYEATARSAIAAAVGVAEGLGLMIEGQGPGGEDTAPDSRATRPVNVGIKWPNDVVAAGRKLGGVLIEQHGDRALVGVGVNVGTRAWKGDLAETAVSLEELGVRAARIDVLEAVIKGIDRAWGLNAAGLGQAYGARDVLRGTPARFESRGVVVEGVVAEVDPLRGLCVQTKVGKRWLDANATTRIE